jgi:hypothetical protein
VGLAVGEDLRSGKFRATGKSRCTIGHRRRLVERAATELARRTAAVLRVAFLASSALEWVSTFAIGMVAMYVGATLLITDLAGAGALAAVLASGAGRAHPHGRLGPDRRC